MAGRWLAAAIVILVLAVPLHAQYVEKQAYEPSSARFVAGGIFFRDFAPRESNSAPDSLVIEFSRIMPFVMFRQGPVDLTLGYTTYPLQGASRSTVFIGTTFTAEFPLTGGRGSSVILPLLLAADFTKAESAGSDRDNFNAASVGIGTGLKYRLAGEDVDVAVEATGVIHYSFQGYNLEGGSSSAVLGEAIAVLKHVPLFGGIAAGYRLRIQRWTTGGIFDYVTTNHGIFVGVLF